MKMAVCFNLLRRKFSFSIPRPNGIEVVTVVGAGLMGSGIAQVTAQASFNVTLVDVDRKILQKSEESIKKSLRRLVTKSYGGMLMEGEQFFRNSLEKITFSTDLEKAVAEADLVVEAIVEKIELKHKLFSSIDSIAPQKTIFASNTSSLPISEIASVTKRKDRFGGLHFFNPVPMMKLLEVIRLPETSEDTFNAMLEWGKKLGKTCVTCKDTPGFIVNRLLLPLLAEAMRMLERGDATPQDIDLAMKLGASFPMGPLELSDYVGLDTVKLILDGWHKRFPDNELFKPIKILDKLVGEGKLGLKTGEGFYTYLKSQDTGR